MRRTHAGRGFTLIELLVVVAVIALLLGILLPALTAARQSAKTLEAVTAARSLMQAYAMYANDYDSFVMHGHMAAVDAAYGVVDESGNLISPPVSQRWPYRLGPYFEYEWAGTTHIGARAELLARRDEILNGPGGTFDWSYQVSVFPSFGINSRYVGGDHRRQSWIDERYHIRRISDAIDPASLLTFASARFFVGSLQYDGYVDISPPPVGAIFDETASTASPLTAFGHVHPRYGGKAVVGWLDGHADPLGTAGLTDRRNWANPARKAGDPDWEPPAGG